MNFVVHRNCNSGWRVYLAPTWGRHKDIQLLNNATKTYQRSGVIPSHERLHLINYRHLTFDETEILKKIVPQLGVAQFEYVLWAQRRVNRWANRSESVEKLMLMWEIECLLYFMRPDIDLYTTWDLHIAHQTAT